MNDYSVLKSYVDISKIDIIDYLNSECHYNLSVEFISNININPDDLQYIFENVI